MGKDGVSSCGVSTHGVWHMGCRHMGCDTWAKWVGWALEAFFFLFLPALSTPGALGRPSSERCCERADAERWSGMALVLEVPTGDSIRSPPPRANCDPYWPPPPGPPAGGVCADCRFGPPPIESCAISSRRSTGTDAIELPTEATERPPPERPAERPPPERAPPPRPSASLLARSKASCCEAKSAPFACAPPSLCAPPPASDACESAALESKPKPAFVDCERSSERVPSVCCSPRACEPSPRGPS